METATTLPEVLPAAIAPEFLLFGIAGLVSLVAFGFLILAPALGAYGRPWEKAAAGFLSLFVLAALVMIGIAVGSVVVYYWNDITGALGL
ncbi:MAG: hypothetical protein ACKOPI_07320 [bacterium]